VENLAPTGIRSPDRPTRSESLYRLRYLGPFKTNGKVKVIGIWIAGAVNMAGVDTQTWWEGRAKLCKCLIKMIKQFTSGTSHLLYGRQYNKYDVPEVNCFFIILIVKLLASRDIFNQTCKFLS
jgi:hypothetical protein